MYVNDKLIIRCKVVVFIFSRINYISFIICICICIVYILYLIRVEYEKILNSFTLVLLKYK